MWVAALNDGRPAKLHEAYQQGGRHEDMSAAIGQPKEILS